MGKVAILYIAGYGRSGSTLLERILNSHPRIFGGGEMAVLPYLVDQPKPRCACGQLLDECEYWSPVVRRLQADRTDLLNFQAAQRHWEQLQLPRPGRKKTADLYFAFNRIVFDELQRGLPSQILIVDSSKTSRAAFYRPWALQRIAGYEVKMLHLVRDGRGCLWSNLKGSNLKMESGQDPSLRLAGLRTTLHWPLANIGAHLFQLANGREKYIRIRYEDLVTRPSDVLTRLGCFLELDFQEQIQSLQEGDPIPLSHQVAGNRLRSKEKLVLRQDQEWEQRLSSRHRFLFWLLNWPLALVYGYRMGTSGSSETPERAKVQKNNEERR